KLLIDGLGEGKAIVLPCILILARILVIYAIYLSGLEQSIRFDLQASQDCRRIGGEVRISRTRRKDHNPTLFEVPCGTATDKWLGNFGHINGRLHPRGDAHLFDGSLKGQTVHDRAHHSHVIGNCAVDPAGFTKSTAANKVAAPDHDRNLYAEL